MQDKTGLRIEVAGVSYSLGEKTIVKEVSVSLAAGEFVCLLGRNGAGKTTLARLIAGELTPTQGRVLLNEGDSNREATKVRRNIAYLPQDLQDPPFVTVRELVTLGRFNPARSIGWRVGSKDKEAVQECIESCHLESLADRPFSQLSGGEKQLAWLAFCLAQQRGFLLLDESLHNMDYSRKELFFGMLSNLADDGKGVILITHDLDMAMRHGRRLMLLDEGRLAHDGPASPQIYSLLGL